MSTIQRAEETDRPLQILIVYYSRFGAIKELAGIIAEGVGKVHGASVDLLAVEEQPLGEARGDETDEQVRQRRGAITDRLARADALIIGGPAYFGSMASPLKRFFEDCATAESTILDRTRPWHHYLFRDKPGAAFTSSATPHGGNEQALLSILTMLIHLGMIVVTPGQRGPILEQPSAPYGATAITGPSGYRELSAQEQEEARYLGERVATIAGRLRAGWQTEVAARQDSLLESSAQPFDPSA
jgi:NAD(P)H dehydrogenase (quinone)